MANNSKKPRSITDDLNKDYSHIIFSSDDQKLKMLGEIFGNITSRNIITLLIENEMTAMQISNKLSLKINLVMYHLDKMLSLEIISITKKTKNSRGHTVKHYRAKQAVMIFSKNAKNRAEKSKMLSKIIKRVTRFSAISIAGVCTWILTNISIQSDRMTNMIDTASKYPRPTLPHYMNHIEPQTSSDAVIPILLSVGVIVSLLTMERVIIPRIRQHLRPVK